MLPVSIDRIDGLGVDPETDQVPIPNVNVPPQIQGIAGKIANDLARMAKILCTRNPLRMFTYNILTVNNWNNEFFSELTHIGSLAYAEAANAPNMNYEGFLENICSLFSASMIYRFNALTNAIRDQQLLGWAQEQANAYNQLKNRYMGNMGGMQQPMNRPPMGGMGNFNNPGGAQMPQHPMMSNRSPMGGSGMGNFNQDDNNASSGSRWANYSRNNNNNKFNSQPKQMNDGFTESQVTKKIEANSPIDGHEYMSLVPDNITIEKTQLENTKYYTWEKKVDKSKHSILDGATNIKLKKVQKDININTIEHGSKVITTDPDDLILEGQYLYYSNFNSENPGIAIIHSTIYTPMVIENNSPVKIPFSMLVPSIINNASSLNDLSNKIKSKLNTTSSITIKQALLKLNNYLTDLVNESLVAQLGCGNPKDATYVTIEHFYNDFNDLEMHVNANLPDRFSVAFAEWSKNLIGLLKTPYEEMDINNILGILPLSDDDLEAEEFKVSFTTYHENIIAIIIGFTMGDFNIGKDIYDNIPRKITPTNTPELYDVILRNGIIGRLNDNTQTVYLITSDNSIFKIYRNYINNCYNIAYVRNV